MIYFNRFHTGFVADGRLVLHLIADNEKKYEFSMSPQTAALVMSAISANSMSIAEQAEASLVPHSVQPIIGPDIEPGLRFELGGNLAINLSLPSPQLQALKVAIAELEASNPPQGRRH